MGRYAMALLLVLICVSAQAQTDSAVLLDQLSGLIDRGKLNVAVDLKAGSAAIGPRVGARDSGRAVRGADGGSR